VHNGRYEELFITAMTGLSERCSHSGHPTWALLHTGHSLERANIFSLAVGYAAMD
jgi:hypothetical protein